MRAGAHARRPAGTGGAQVALGGLHDRPLGIGVDQRRALEVSNLDHANVVVGTRVGAGSAADARVVVDDHHAAPLGAVDRARRATDHAHRVGAVHARIGHHPVIVSLAVADEHGIAAVGRGAGAHAVVAPRAAVEVDEHRLGAVDEPLLDRPLHRRIVREQATRGHLGLALRRCLDLGEHMRLEHVRRHPQHVDVAERGERGLQRQCLALAPAVVERGKAVIVSGAEVGERTLAGAQFHRDAREAGADHEKAVGIIALVGDNRLVLGAPLAAGAQLLVRHVPVEAAVCLEQDAVGHGLQRLLVEIAEQVGLAQVRLKRALAVDRVDCLAEAFVELADLAQPLPTDLEQLRVGLGEHARGARHPPQRRELAEQRASRQRRGLVLVEHRRNVLQDDMGRRAFPVAP